jgi:predicted transcriptional regulator
MLGVRLDPETERGLDAIARRTKRPKSQIAREVIRAYVSRFDHEARAREEWRQISASERGDPSLDAMLDAALDELDGEG